MSKYGKKPVYLKAETECLDETDTPVRLPRYTQFTIKNIISQNNSPYVFLELEDIDGKNYKIKAAFTHTSVVDVILQSDNYFTDLFGIGNLRTKYPNITEEVWNMISRGKVRKGMTTDECRLAVGNPMRIHIVTGGYETWSYERKTLDFTNKKLDRIH